MSGGPRAVRVRVTGRVQGVSFRAWTQGRARALGLDGWVRNEPDGSVSALFGGESSAVDEMLSALHIGPRWSNVTGIEAAEVEISEVPPGFRITG
ncbi:MAG: acylphosphatase [Maritimibacter sp.]|nr:acylphosphatase [Maritimibacter sp.]